MKNIIALALLSASLLTPNLSAAAAPTAVCQSQQDCEQAMRQFYDIKKTIKLNLTSGSVVVEPDGRHFTVKKTANFKFVGFLKLTVNGAGTIEKSFPNGERGGTVSFNGQGTIEYNDSGEVVFDSAGVDLTSGLKVSANDVTKVVLLDNTSGTATNCHYVYAFRNSTVYAKDCESVCAYTNAVVTAERCKRTEAHDNAKLTQVK